MAWENISGDAAQDLINWLAAHEDDIKNGINDFGDLRTIFLEIFDRDAGGPMAECEPW